MSSSPPLYDLNGPALTENYCRFLVPPGFAPAIYLGSAGPPTPQSTIIPYTYSDLELPLALSADDIFGYVFEISVTPAPGSDLPIIALRWRPPGSAENPSCPPDCCLTSFRD